MYDPQIPSQWLSQQPQSLLFSEVSPGLQALGLATNDSRTQAPKAPKIGLLDLFLLLFRFDDFFLLLAHALKAKATKNAGGGKYKTLVKESSFSCFSS